LATEPILHLLADLWFHRVEVGDFQIFAEAGAPHLYLVLPRIISIYDKVRALYEFWVYILQGVSVIPTQLELRQQVTVPVYPIGQDLVFPPTAILVYVVYVVVLVKCLRVIWRHIVPASR